MRRAGKNSGRRYGKLRGIIKFIAEIWKHREIEYKYKAS